MVDIDIHAAPGWDAITDALEQVYPGVEPDHFGTMVKWALGGPDPLDGVSIYRRPDHWHYVSYGMSELYEKQSEWADLSGWGFEFTFRLARSGDDEKPPIWPVNLLQNLARYVFASGNVFDIGHKLNLNGPIATNQPDTAIRAVAFAEDPELGRITTPHGRLRFLQVVGLTLDEYAVMKQWNSMKLLDILAPYLPLYITDTYRHNLADDPRIVDAINEGIRNEGSSAGSLYLDEVSWRSEGESTVIAVGAHTADTIAKVLAGRIPFGRGLSLDGPKGGVRFKPGEQADIAEGGEGYLVVDVTKAMLAELATLLRPQAGTYALSSAPGLALEIQRSYIRDSVGTVVQEIG